MNNKKRILYPTLLSGVSVLFFILTIIWISRDKGGTFISDAAHLFNASSHYQSLKSMDIPSFMLVRELYPNLFHQLTAILSFITGNITLSSAILNALFVILLMFGTYFIVSHLWNHDDGLVSSIIIPGFTGISHFSLINNIDIALAATVVWAIYFLILSDSFRSRKYTILFFVACSIGMLIKWAFAFFMVVPFIIVLVKAIREKDNESISHKKDFLWLIIPIISYIMLLVIVSFLGRDEMGYPPPDRFWTFYLIVTMAGIVALALFLLKSNLKDTPPGNLLAGSILFIILTNHFYLFSFQFLLKTYMGRFWGGTEIQKHASTRSVYHFLVKFLALDYVGIPILLCILVGIIYYLVRGNRTLQKNIPLWSSLSAVLIFAFQPIYDTRYFIPLTGFLSGFAVFWIFSIKSKVIRVIILIPLLVISFLAWSGWILLPGSVEYIFPGIKIVRPSDENWKKEEIVSKAMGNFRENSKPGKSGLFIIYNRCAARGIKPLVLMYYFSAKLNPHEKIYVFPENMDLRRNIGESPVIYYITPVRDDIGKESESGSEIIDKYNETGIDTYVTWESISPDLIYIIIFTPERNPESIPGLLPIKIEDRFVKSGDEWVVISQCPLPGGNSAFIFKMDFQ